MVHWLVLSVSNEFPESFFLNFAVHVAHRSYLCRRTFCFFSNIDYTFFLVGRGESIGGAK